MKLFRRMNDGQHVAATKAQGLPHKRALGLAALAAMTWWASPSVAAAPSAGKSVSPAGETFLPTWGADEIQARCAAIEILTRRDIEQLIADDVRFKASADAKSPKKAQAYTHQVLARWNTLTTAFEDIEHPVYFIGNVSTDDAARRAADACNLKLSSFETSLFQDERLFAVFKDLAATGDPVQAKLISDMVEGFRATGAALPPEPRARAKQIFERLESLRQQFDRNIRENATRLSFSEDELKGVPASITQKAKRDAQGRVTLGFDYPEYIPFMTYAENAAARERYWLAFQTRGTPKNLEILSEITNLRRELAGIQGLPSFSDLILRTRMAEKPANVDKFLADVKAAIRQAEDHDLAMLRKAKAEHLGLPLEQVKVERWDVQFYEERLKKAKFSVDQEAVRKYFPTKAAVDWALDVAAQLYGLRFEKAQAPVWHEDVSYRRVFDARTGKFLGGIYLDLYPRANKYRHAAVFPVRMASYLVTSDKGVRHPISAMVCNFNRDGLDLREVETLFHEFGHALHGVMSQARYVQHGGTRVERDFVEAPSQMYEAWALDRQSLVYLERACPTCPKIDDGLIARFRAAKDFGKGLHYSGQHAYASMDMGLHSPQPGDAMERWKQVSTNTALGFAKGSEFPGTFNHIAGGYGSAYYGYMWSEVLGEDMLSAFGRNIMDPKVGRRLRSLVLSQGGQKKAATMVRDFLGREPSAKAFFDRLSKREG